MSEGQDYPDWPQRAGDAIEDRTQVTDNPRPHQHDSAGVVRVAGV